MADEPARSGETIKKSDESRDENSRSDESIRENDEMAWPILIAIKHLSSSTRILVAARRECELFDENSRCGRYEKLDEMSSTSLLVGGLVDDETTG